MLKGNSRLSLVQFAALAAILVECGLPELEPPRRRHPALDTLPDITGRRQMVRYSVVQDPKTWNGDRLAAAEAKRARKNAARLKQMGAR